MSAATVYISESNGAGEVVTDQIANMNFGSVDAPNIVAANHPIIQDENSYFKMLRFKVASLGTSTTIKDLRWWKSAGGFVSDEMIYVADRAMKQANGGGGAAIPFTRPAQVLKPQPPFYSDFDSDSFIRTADPGSATVGINGSVAGTITAPDIGTPTAYSEYFAGQLFTTLNTPRGPVNTKSILFQYDES